MMVYYGAVDPGVAEIGTVYSFLQDALARRDEATPLPGPREYVRGEWRYDTSWEGDIERYEGTESIFAEGTPVYRGWYAGGLVDRRGE